MQYFRKPNLEDRGWRAILCQRRALHVCERWHKNRYYWATRPTIGHLSVVKIFVFGPRIVYCRFLTDFCESPLRKMLINYYFCIFSTKMLTSNSYNFFLNDPINFKYNLASRIWKVLRFSLKWDVVEIATIIRTRVTSKMLEKVAFCNIFAICNISGESFHVKWADRATRPLQIWLKFCTRVYMTKMGNFQNFWTSRPPPPPLRAILII